MKLELKNGVAYNKVTVTFDHGAFSSNLDALPDYAGVYFVYRAYKGQDDKWKINPNEAPVYIGKAEDSVRSRMKDHERDMDITNWINDYCNQNDDLFICTAPVDIESLSDLEASSIYHIQSKANVINKESYNGGNIHVLIGEEKCYLSAANKNFYVNSM